MGSDGGEEPWLSCVTDTNNVIGFAIGAMFVRQVFQGNSKTVVCFHRSTRRFDLTLLLRYYLILLDFSGGGNDKRH